GMDRVCSASGALEISSKENMINNDQYMLTIDFGTATTINVVAYEGIFIGGLIVPGLQTMLKSLKTETAQLPVPDLKNFDNIIGSSTDSSIVSGVITSTVGMINEVIHQLKSRGNQIQPVIFATGGNAGYILPHIRHKIFFDEALVLKGLKVIFELNKN
ncbi:MAG: type III pantothenate kinase, partial [Ignavibacteriales bacterium]